MKPSIGIKFTTNLVQSLICHEHIVGSSPMDGTFYVPLQKNEYSPVFFVDVSPKGMRQKIYRCTRPEASPPISRLTSDTVAKLTSPKIECFKQDAAAA